MKIQTKAKILKWVNRLLKYDETMRKMNLIHIEECKLKHVRAQHCYQNKELQMLDPAQIEFALRMQLVDYLFENKLIKYVMTPDPRYDNTIVSTDFYIYVKDEPNRKG
jgi:hypothetical protein